MAKNPDHLEAIRYFRDGPGVPARDTGELISFKDTADRAAMGLKWGLDHPDWEIRRRNIAEFQRSLDCKLRTPYRKRLF